LTDDKVVTFPGSHPGWDEASARTVEADLTKALGMPVSIESGAGDHIITIRANGLEGLDRFCHTIMKGAEAIK
jgi:hypothetical protein